MRLRDSLPPSPPRPARGSRDLRLTALAAAEAYDRAPEGTSIRDLARAWKMAPSRVSILIRAGTALRSAPPLLARQLERRGVPWAAMQAVVRVDRQDAEIARALWRWLDESAPMTGTKETRHVWTIDPQWIARDPAGYALHLRLHCERLLRRSEAAGLPAGHVQHVMSAGQTGAGVSDQEERTARAQAALRLLAAPPSPLAAPAAPSLPSPLQRRASDPPLPRLAYEPIALDPGEEIGD